MQLAKALETLFTYLCMERLDQMKKKKKYKLQWLNNNYLKKILFYDTLKK